MYWRLGLDLGTNSIGFAAFGRRGTDGRDLANWSLLDLGVRIYSDSREPSKGGRIGDGLAVQRRLARGMRRTRDRRINRLNHMMSMLVRFGLMPADKADRQKLEALDPYEIRNRAVDEAVPPHELGRALFHLAKRRGFKSNRKQAGDEDGMRAGQISALRDAKGALTLGQFLYREAQKGHGIRFRGDNDWFPDRAMYAEEFDRIRETQQPHHSLSDTDWDRLRLEGVLFQHPLKPVERGWCSLFPGERRAHRDTPIAQTFRIYNEVGNLKWIDTSQEAHDLTAEQRTAVIDFLMTKKSRTFGAIRKLKDADGKPLFPRNSRFNLEDDDRRKNLSGHLIACMMQDDPALAKMWEDRDRFPLDDIFEALHDADDDETLILKLVDEFGLSRHQAATLAALPLSSVTQSLSLKAMEALLPIMQHQLPRYDEAVGELTDADGNPLHHSLEADPGQFEHLPYYGEILTGSTLGANREAEAATDPEAHYGRLPNPTVHVALNQLRKVVNSLIDRIGCPPSEIHVELSRDLKLGPKRRTEINREIAKNTKRNDRLRDYWRGLSRGAEATAQDLKKLKLWEELGADELARRCVFTGRVIAGHHLINGEVEVEHLLPFSRTLDDGMANLTLAFRDANRAKANDTPFEAFGQKTRREYDWDAILDRASRLPPAKRWRFGPEAMDQFDGDRQFIARQMTDNAVISRLARRYLRALTTHVVPAPGRLTAMVRGKWHLNLGDHNTKSRDDHRHHAIDAFVVGLAGRGLLAFMSRASAKGQDDRLHIRTPDLPDTLRSALARHLDTMVISHKPDHGHQGRLYQESAYGVLAANDPATRDDYNLVIRKPVTSLSVNELAAIRDRTWREKVEDYLYAQGFYDLSKPEKDKKLPELMSAFGQANGVKKLRILIKNQSATVIPSAPYKAYTPDSFVACDVWRLPAGKPGRWKPGAYKWQGRFWSYDECGPDGVPAADTGKPHPAAKFVCRLFKHDMVAYEEDGGAPVIMRVAGFSTTNNRLDLKPHRAANAPQKYHGINVLGAAGLRKISVSPDGQVRGL